MALFHPSKPQLEGLVAPDRYFGRLEVEVGYADATHRVGIATASNADRTNVEAHNHTRQTDYNSLGTSSRYMHFETTAPVMSVPVPEPI